MKYLCTQEDSSIRGHTKLKLMGLGGHLFQSRSRSDCLRCKHDLLLYDPWECVRLLPYACSLFILRDKKICLSRCPFVPGLKKFPCPPVPLFRDKRSSKTPGTNSSVPGCPGKKSLFQKNKNPEKDILQQARLF